MTTRRFRYEFDVEVTDPTTMAVFTNDFGTNADGEPGMHEASDCETALQMALFGILQKTSELGFTVHVASNYEVTDG